MRKGRSGGRGFEMETTVSDSHFGQVAMYSAAMPGILTYLMHHTGLVHTALRTVLYLSAVIVLLNITLVAVGLTVHYVGRLKRSKQPLQTTKG